MPRRPGNKIDVDLSGYLWSGGVTWLVGIPGGSGCQPMRVNSVRKSAVLDVSQSPNHRNVAEHTCPQNITHNLYYPWRIVIHRSLLCFFAL
jgi:hypothetical protein